MGLRRFLGLRKPSSLPPDYSEVGPITPFMEDDERELFDRRYRSASKIVEFGAGGSTVFAAAETSARIVSVESDYAWLERLRREPEIAEAEKTGRVCLLHADIGPTKKWGYPVGDSFKSAWPVYAERPWPVLPDPDLIFIDGRFRLACMLASAMKAPQATVMVHDFRKRKKYHAALDFFSVEESANSLVVLRRREADEDKIAQAFARALLDPA